MNNVSPPTTKRSRIVYFFWNNMPRFVFLGLMALAVVLVLEVMEQSKILAAKKAAEAKQEKPPVNAVTFNLSPSSVRDKINLPGSIEPWTKLELMSKLSGTVEKVLVKEGDRVKKGDILAHIEADDYKIALKRAQAAYKLAKAEYERDKSIHSKGVIATSALETMNTTLQTATADLENAKLQLSRTIVKSPMDGIIRRMDAKVGLLLSVGDPIAMILEVDRLKGVVGIPESDVSAVRKLDVVDISVQALEKKQLKAKKYFLSPMPDSFARLYNLELEIDNTDGQLLAGMFIRANIIKKQIDGVITVPFYSVISRNEEQYVYIVENGVAKKRQVELGIMEEWMVQITKGLNIGDQLMIEGHRDVEDDQKVKIVKAIENAKDLIL